MDKYSIEWHRHYGKCCDCGKPISETPPPGVNIVLTHYKANWKFPVGGNFATGTSGMAATMLCDNCIKKQPSDFKYCIEYNQQGEGILYHPVGELEKDPLLARL